MIPIAAALLIFLADQVHAFAPSAAAPAAAAPARVPASSVLLAVQRPVLPVLPPLSISSSPSSSSSSSILVSAAVTSSSSSSTALAGQQRHHDTNLPTTTTTTTLSVAITAIIIFLALPFLFSVYSAWSASTSPSSLQQQLQTAAASLWDVTITIQRIGENAFTATLIVAALQAIVALVQYRTNPMGQLAVPPGLTVGVEYPAPPPNNNIKNNNNNSKSASQNQKAAAARRTLNRIRYRKTSGGNEQNYKRRENAVAVVARNGGGGGGGWWSRWRKRTIISSGGGEELIVATTTFGTATASAVLERVVQKKAPPLPPPDDIMPLSSSSSLLENNNYTAAVAADATDTYSPSSSTLSSSSSSTLDLDLHSKQQSKYSIIINRINQFLFLLLPWTAQRAGLILQEKVHLFHIAFIMGMATLLDFPAAFQQKRCYNNFNNNHNHSHKKHQQQQLLTKTESTTAITGVSNNVGSIATTTSTTKQVSTDSSGRSSRSSRQPWSSRLTSTTTTTTTTTANADVVIPSTMTAAATAVGSTAAKMKGSNEKMQKNLERIVVIGDSLAVGLGCVDMFDRNRNNTLDFCRIENVNPQQQQQPHSASSANNSISPVFPKRLAQRLAQRLNKPIHWRSAGVDGGASAEIAEFCVPMIQELVQDNKTPPDIVVILGGINDLKASFTPSGSSAAAASATRSAAAAASRSAVDGNHAVATTTTSSSSKMLGGKILGGPRLYRQQLAGLITEILTLAPNATVVLPAIPTQMFHKHSPLNIFPLALVLDALVGFWDSQKKLVADSFGGWLQSNRDDDDDENMNKKSKNDVVYIGISAQDVALWYKPRRHQEGIIANGDDMDNDEYDDDDEDENEEDITLLAIDGVHPNKRCYSRWAETVADRLLDYFERRGE